MNYYNPSSTGNIGAGKKTGSWRLQDFDFHSDQQLWTDLTQGRRQKAKGSPLSGGRGLKGP